MKIPRKRISVLYKTAIYPDNIPEWIRPLVLERDHYTCAFCGQPTKYLCHNLTFSRKGETKLENLLTCCRACSWKKGELTAKEFRADLKRKKQIGWKEDELELDAREWIEKRKRASVPLYQSGGVYKEKIGLELDKKLRKKMRSLGIKEGKVFSEIVQEALRKNLDKYIAQKTQKIGKVASRNLPSARNVKRDKMRFLLDSATRQKLWGLATEKRRSPGDIVTEVLGEYLKDK